MEIASYIMLATPIQVLSPYWMMWCYLGHNPEK